MSVLDSALELLGEKGLAKQEGRIAFQKLVLLMQMARNESGYRFLWGLFGPYSATLAEDMHDRLAQSLAGEPTPAKNEVLEEVKSVCAGYAPDLSSYETLELLTSYLYVRDRLQMTPEAAIEFLENNPRKRELVEKLAGSKDRPERITLLEDCSSKLLSLNSIQGKQAN